MPKKSVQKTSRRTGNVSEMLSLPLGRDAVDHNCWQGKHGTWPAPRRTKMPEIRGRTAGTISWGVTEPTSLSI
ncbi:hypothetical protein BaRGS_00039844 [Batillaria attramentaria]|uniref:Uncharacterized protein n=1 Tax=Batillaria attramentaria TaxID=370345 RepID=A0ABD0J269_9CAEN